MYFFFFFQAEDGIRDKLVTGVQTCALPISAAGLRRAPRGMRVGLHVPAEEPAARPRGRQRAVATSGRPRRCSTYQRDRARRGVRRTPVPPGPRESLRL